jgi:hypothetical protein
MSEQSSGRRYQVTDPRVLLVNFIDTLPPREAEIAKLHYGIGGPAFTEAQIAQMFKMTSETTSKTLANIQRWLSRVDLMWVAQSFQHQSASR